MKILCVVGARPNFMKIAPVLSALRAAPHIFVVKLVHTGQHYDNDMNAQFFLSLGIPEPDVNLEVGSGSHAVQTAEIMRRFEPVLDAEKPTAILVVGDVNSTIACALVAVKKNVLVIHVEAGLRSFDRAMPEEVNRVLTDQISDLLFITERSAEQNLINEGISSSRIHFVGNVMIDTLHHNLERATPVKQSLTNAGLTSAAINQLKRYAVVTLHRPSNVDDKEKLASLLTTLRAVSERIPLIFPLHPRTRANCARFGVENLLASEHVIILPPLGYLEMLGLMKDATVVLTDSGGIQEETTALGVPCLTLRHNTERPITVAEGTNTVVGQNHARILAAVEDVLTSGGKRGKIPEFWDGKASLRIRAILSDALRADKKPAPAEKTPSRIQQLARK